METPAHIKFENSPADSLADSFVSTPGTAYPPLFDDDMSPMDMNDAMTPQSYDDNFRGSTMDPSIAGSPAPEKKPVKKRKSWGQQLPEPKTNLPPRKRAKTEDEKEQRRVERVLRNRRAAQSSRERKRLEVEKLEAEKQAVERRAKDLELRLQAMEERNAMLTRQLQQLGGSMPIFESSPVASSPVAELRQSTPVTFSADIFGQQETENRPISTQSLPQQPAKTVNPAALSPEMRPVAESSNATSSDLTQHPAVSVGGASALDGFSLNTYGFQTLDNSALGNAFLRDYLENSHTSDADIQFLEHGLPTIANDFNSELDNLAHYDNSFVDFNSYDELINYDDQPAPEIQSSDQLAETTASLQPQIGASS